MQGAAGPMFPFEDEELRTWSEYGAVLKPDEFRKTRSEPLLTQE